MPTYKLTDEERRACYHAGVECRCENIERRRIERIMHRPADMLPAHVEDLHRRPRGIGAQTLDCITLSEEEWQDTIAALRFKAEWYKGRHGPKEIERAVSGAKSYQEWRDWYEELADELEQRKPINAGAAPLRSL